MLVIIALVLIIPSLYTYYVHLISRYFLVISVDNVERLSMKRPVFMINMASIISIAFVFNFLMLCWPKTDIISDLKMPSPLYVSLCVASSLQPD